MITHHISSKLTKLRRKKSVGFTLSDFFPSGTIYFYGYPSGEAGSFLNLVDPYTEETVAARASYVAGENIKTLVFSASTHAVHDKEIASIAGLASTKKSLLVFPKGLDGSLKGKQRNDAVKKYLRHEISNGTLVMAQPFPDKDVRAKFQINPDLTVWLNDKKNMRSYIPELLLPKTYALYETGSELYKNRSKLKTPVVIKVSSSSAGDGVYLCRDDRAVLETVKNLKAVNASIIVEELIEERENYGVQFGIPHDSTKPIEIIGISKQITSKDGVFLGGLLESREIPTELQPAIDALLTTILPFARELGWYGVGCYDVLISKDGDIRFIDSNFRMTGMSAFLLSHKPLGDKKVITSSASYTGSRNDFIKFLKKYTDSSLDAYLKIVSITKNENIWRINAGVVFDSSKHATELIKKLFAEGINSEGLATVVKTKVLVK